MRAAVLALTLLTTLPTSSWADWQAKPFIGVTFAGATTFVDLDRAAGERKFTLGGSVTWLGNFIGVEADLARVPGYFQASTQESIVSSHITTLTGNLVVTVPRQTAGYGLRPYLVAGGGTVWVSSVADEEIFHIERAIGVMDLGGGVTGFLTDRVGVNWDVRYFRSVGGEDNTGLAIGKEQISFWRASMGVAIRLGPTPGSTP